MDLGCICGVAVNVEKRRIFSSWHLAVCCAMNLQTEGRTAAEHSLPAGCYADCQGNYISGCLVSMVAPSETVAKQFWHLSNRSTVTATTKPPADGQQEERQHKADSRQRPLSGHTVSEGTTTVPLHNVNMVRVWTVDIRISKEKVILDNPIIHVAIREYELIINSVWVAWYTESFLLAGRLKVVLQLILQGSTQRELLQVSLLERSVDPKYAQTRLTINFVLTGLNALCKWYCR